MTGLPRSSTDGRNPGRPLQDSVSGALNVSLEVGKGSSPWPKMIAASEPEKGTEAGHPDQTRLSGGSLIEFKEG